MSEDSEDQTLEPASQIEDLPDFKLDETNFHNKLYDCYSLELNDLQILIGKSRENWRYALNKGTFKQRKFWVGLQGFVAGTSNLHVVDRFNISLQIERRVVYTSDPLFPSLTLNANLPKLVGMFT